MLIEIQLLVSLERRNDVLSSEVRHYSAKVGGLGRRGWDPEAF